MRGISKSFGDGGSRLQVLKGIDLDEEKMPGIQCLTSPSLLTILDGHEHLETL